MRSTFTSAWRSVLPICVFLASFSSHAGYTVIEEDLYPSHMSTAHLYRSNTRTGPTEELNSDKFKITFVKGSSTLLPMASSFLDEMIPRLRNAAQIRIVSRTDRTSANETKKSRQLGTARASVIRTYLINHGISSRVLDIEVEPEGNPDASIGFSTTEVIFSLPLTVRSPRNERSIPRQYKYLDSASNNAPVGTATLAAAQSPRRIANEEAMLQYINQAVRAGQMESSVALQLLQSLVNTGSANSSAYVQPTQQALATPVDQSTRLAVEVGTKPAAVTGWEILPSDGTLQNTLTRWGTAANWEVHWKDVPEIKNPGYIKLPDREFLSAAEYVLSKAKLAAKAVGIDISIKAYSNRVLVISKDVQK